MCMGGFDLYLNARQKMPSRQTALGGALWPLDRCPRQFEGSRKTLPLSAVFHLRFDQERDGAEMCLLAHELGA